MYLTNFEALVQDTKPGTLPKKPCVLGMINSAFYRSNINKLGTSDYWRSSAKSNLPSFSGLR